MRQILALLPGGLLLAALWACAGGDEERAIIELIEKAARRAEAHDASGVMALCTENFRAEPGHYPQRAAKAILWRSFKYYEAFTILFPKPEVILSADAPQASVRVPFLILSKNADLPDIGHLYNNPGAWLDRVGELADLYRFNLRLRKSGGLWMVREAVLEKFTGFGFEK